jgi:hypothetical protein
MSKRKNSGFIQIFYTIGTLVIVVMLVIVGINFARDARVLQKPLLSTSTAKQDTSGNPDGFKTIEYKKPAADNTKNTDKTKTTTKPADTRKPEPKPPAAAPVQTPDP